MARINVDDKWWNDPRRKKLGLLLKDTDLADGIMLSLWRLAFDYYKDDAKGIPEHVFECVRGCSEIKQSMLVDVRNKEVYVRGSSEHFAWILKHTEKKRAAGKKSAEARRQKYGTSQPQAPKEDEIVEQTPNTSRTDSNTPEPSSSSSSSFSLSSSGKSSKKRNLGENNIVGIRPEYPQEFEDLWKLYERRGDKKASFGIYKQLKLNREALSALKIGITNYVKSTPEVKYRKHFERFLKTDWMETAQTPVVQLVPKSKAQQIRENNRRLFEQQFAKIKAEKEGLV